MFSRIPIISLIDISSSLPIFKGPCIDDLNKFIEASIQSSIYKKDLFDYHRPKLQFHLHYFFLAVITFLARAAGAFSLPPS